MAITGYKSIHGRIVGRTSTGGLASADSSALYVMRDSTGARLSPLYEPVVTTTSTGGATLTFGGIINIASSATAAAFLLTAPAAGQSCVITISGSASALTFGGTSTSQVFMKVGSGTAGSTTLTLTDANLGGQSMILYGVSATKSFVTHGSTVIQA
jgi:hypothetical protein